MVTLKWSLVFDKTTYGAYIAEIVRSGIHAIDPGQREAAKALGMPWHLEVLKIVAIQATKICILLQVNQFIRKVEKR